MGFDANQECDECGHLISRHGKEGCEVELGDHWVTGNQPSEPTVLMARGPCGCQAYTEENDNESTLYLDGDDDGSGLEPHRR
jgi:hypothetical protein